MAVNSGAFINFYCGCYGGGRHRRHLLKSKVHFSSKFIALLQGVAAVAVTSGANMNFDRLRLVTELADLGGLREAMLATTIPERHGSFSDFLQIAVNDSSLEITEFKYR